MVEHKKHCALHSCEMSYSNKSSHQPQQNRLFEAAETLDSRELFSLFEW